MKEQPLDEEFDSVCGMASCANGFAVAGDKDGASRILLYQTDGTLSTSPEAEVPADTGSLLCIGESADGGFCTLSEPETPGVCRLTQYDTSGHQQRSFRIPKGEDPYTGIMMTAEETWLVWTWQTMSLVRSDGSILSVALPEGTEIGAVERLNDGSLYVVFYEGSEVLLTTIDPFTGKTGESKRYGSNQIRSYIYIGGSLNAPFIWTGQSLQRVDKERERITATMAWTANGHPAHDLCGLIVQNETTYIAITHSLWEGEAALFFFTTKETNVDRQMITVGVMNNGYSHIESLVDFFNATSEEYVAQIRYYDEPMQLAADLTSGNAPDVLEMMHVSVPLNDMYFIDMTQLMEKMPYITPQDFAGNIYQAMQINGKTLFLVDNIYIETVTARTADVGSTPGWTTAQFQQLMEEKGEGYIAFPAWLPPIEMLHWISYNAIGEYVDFETYTCNFENDGFIAQLQMCKNQPDETSEYISLPEYGEHILLHAESLSTPDRMPVIRQNYGMYEYTFIGFPNDLGTNGSFFERGGLSIMLAIPATSPNPDAAWRFVCTMFEDTWQKGEWGIPVTREHMEAELQERLSDRDGDFTGTDAAALTALLEETTVFIYEDSVIREIIEEEAQAFFADETDAAEAARRIQNRVTLYLEEIQ
ncbi:MAG: hypothetical protein IJQ12_05650 [Lachnospiraceae bacterium]|nr:hypothetical protein [Lachnospiraceae bacterium]